MHQKEHWKCHKLVCQNSAVGSIQALQKAQAEVRAKHLFPEHGIAVEAEVFEQEDEEEMQKSLQKANIWEDAG